MRACWLVGISFVWLCVSATAPTLVGLNLPASPNDTTYPNTTEGFKQLLLDMQASAKEGNQEKLNTFIKNTEIPNCDAWLHKMYESDKADSWMGLCEAKSRDPRERDLKELFERIANEDGKFITRNVNDHPQSGKGLEWGWLQAIKQPLEIYWASWLPSSESKESEADPIGYFMYIDGAFRWESGIQSFKPSQSKITQAKIVEPKLVKKVDPIYPPDAASRGVTGTVRVYFVIGGDGAVYNAHAISGEGLSDDASLRKAAEVAVMQWRFQPGTFDGKTFQTTTTVDLTFSPRR